MGGIELLRYARLGNDVEALIEDMETGEQPREQRHLYRQARRELRRANHLLSKEEQKAGQRVARLERLLSSGKGESTLAELARHFRGEELLLLTYDQAQDRLAAERDGINLLVEMRDHFASLEERADTTRKEQKGAARAARRERLQRVACTPLGGAKATKALYATSALLAGALVAGSIGYSLGSSHQEAPTIIKQQITAEKAPGATRYLGPATRGELPAGFATALSQEAFTEGAPYFLIDQDRRIAYAGRMRFNVEMAIPVTTGINPGERTAPDQGTTPSGTYEIVNVRERLTGVRSPSGVKNAYGSTAAVLDTPDRKLARLWNSWESKIWLHAQPAWQDEYLGKANISAGCPHVSESDMQELRRRGYIQRGAHVVIVGGNEWRGLDEGERQAVYERVYEAVVSQEPGREANEDVRRFGRGPEGITALTDHLVRSYQRERVARLGGVR